MNGVLLNLWLYQFITLVEGPIPLDYEIAFFCKQTADSTAITAAGFVLMNKNDFDYEVYYCTIILRDALKLLNPSGLNFIPRGFAPWDEIVVPWDLQFQCIPQNDRAII